jgi:hypothetical protein
LISSVLDNAVLESEKREPDPPPHEEKPKSRESMTQTTPRKTPPGKKDHPSRKDVSTGRSSDSRRGTTTSGKSRTAAEDEIQIAAENGTFRVTQGVFVLH